MGEKTRGSRIFFNQLRRVVGKVKVGEDVGRSEMNYRGLEKNYSPLRPGDGGHINFFPSVPPLSLINERFVISGSI